MMSWWRFTFSLVFFLEISLTVEAYAEVAPTTTNSISVEEYFEQQNTLIGCFLEARKGQTAPPCDPQDEVAFAAPISTGGATATAKDICEAIAKTNVKLDPTTTYYLYPYLPDLGSFDDQPLVEVACGNAQTLYLTDVANKVSASDHLDKMNEREIATLQELLSSPVLGIELLVDGKFGDKTRTAIEKFFRIHDPNGKRSGDVDQRWVLLRIRQIHNKKSKRQKTGGGTNTVSGIIRALDKTRGAAKDVYARIEEEDYQCRSRCDNIIEAKKTAGSVLRQLESLKKAASKLRTANPQSDDAAAKTSRCTLIDHKLEHEILEKVVLVNEKYVIVFRKVNSPRDGLAVIGLDDGEAKAIYDLDRRGLRQRPLPVLNRSVPKIYKDIVDYYLQTTLVNVSLLKEVLGDSRLDPERITPNQADAFVKTLNGNCDGVASFRLPNEFEMEYAMKRAIFPNGMNNPETDAVACRDMRSSDSARAAGFFELAGSHWQITSSTCEPYDRNSPRMSCAGRVLKGGTSGKDGQLAASLVNCLPQTRDVSPGDFGNPFTSFRLVLEVGK